MRNIFNRNTVSFNHFRQKFKSCLFYRSRSVFYNSYCSSKLGGSLTSRGVPSWLHRESVAQCRVFCNTTCKNSIFRDKICTCYAEKTVGHTQCSRLFGKVKPPNPSFCGFIASFFSAGRGLQESQQNGLQFLVKSCIMRANLSFDRFRPKSTIDLTPDWAV